MHYMYHPNTSWMHQMKMMRGVQNEMFTFEIDSEIAIVDCFLPGLYSWRKSSIMSQDAMFKFI